MQIQTCISLMSTMAQRDEHVLSNILNVFNVKNSEDNANRATMLCVLPGPYEVEQVLPAFADFTELVFYVRGFALVTGPS